MAIRERVSWHGPDTVAALWSAARRHGVAVCAAVPLNPSQMSEVLTAPRMVGLSRPTPASMEDFLKQASRSLRGDLRSIKQQNYTWSWDDDLTRLPEFLTRFHRPSIDARHGEEGYALDQGAIDKLQGSAAHRLGRVFRNGQWVGGMLVEYVGESIWMRQLGWLDGSEAELRAGVVGALYLACVERAVELKVDRMIFGVADPFLEDGLFAYKAKWGAELDASTSSPVSLGWAFDPSHPEGRRFLQEHALLVSSAGNKHAVLGARLPKLDARHVSLKAGLAGWYRLLDQPDPAGGVANTGLPPRLRPWFVWEALPDF